MKRRPAPPHRPSARRGGGPLILFALTAFVLVALTGLALDLAWVKSAEQQLQASADSASLAAARLVRQDSQATEFAVTRQAAVSAASANTVAKASVIVAPNPSNAPNGDVVVGRWDPVAKTFTPDTAQPDAVRVTARRVDGSGGGPLGLFFGQMFGVASSDVERTAVARAELSDDAAGALVLAREQGPEVRRQRRAPGAGRQGAPQLHGPVRPQHDRVADPDRGQRVRGRDRLHQPGHAERHLERGRAAPGRSAGQRSPRRASRRRRSP